MSNGLIRIDDLHDSLKEPQYDTPQTTTAEVTSLNCLNKNLVSLVITGKTIVNILGVAGDCEDVSLWSTWQTNIALDNTNKVFGNNGIKVTLSATAGTMYLQSKFIWDPTQYYCLSAYLKNGNTTGGIAIAKDGDKGGIWKSSPLVTDTTKFVRSWIKIQPSDIKLGDNIIVSFGTVSAGQYAYVDGVMLEEISAVDYANPNWAPSPYVTNDTNVGDAPGHIRSRGKNLINLVQGTYLSQNGSFFVLNTRLGHKDGAVSVNPNTVYTVGLNTPLKYVYAEYDSSRNLLNTTEWSTATITTLKITTGPNTKFLGLAFKLDETTILYPENYQIMLNEGDTALHYEPYQETIMPILYPLRSLNGIADIQDTKKGKVYKRVEKILLDGNLNWTIDTSKTGFKVVRVPIPNYVYRSSYTLKYNNKDIKDSVYGSIINTADLAGFGSIDGYYYISIPQADSGWGDSYSPTVDEIKAYFDGWRMYASGGNQDPWNNQSGATKWWGKILPNGSLYDGQNTLPAVLNDKNYVPYRLYYQLAQTQEIDIPISDLLGLPGGSLVIESDAQCWVRPTVAYTPNRNSRADLESLMQEIARNNSYKLLNGVCATAKDLNYYVDANKGDDINNNGLTPDKPFKTVMKAVNSLPQVINHNIIIQLADGVYNEDVGVYGKVGYGYLLIVGKLGVLNDSVIVNSVGIDRCSIKITVEGIKANSTTKNGFDVYMSRNVQLRFCKSDVVAAGPACFGFSESTGQVANCIGSNHTFGLFCFANSSVSVNNNTGTGNTIGMRADCSTIMKYGTTNFGGTTAEHTMDGGAIR